MALTLETMSWIAGIAAVPVAVVLAVIGWSKSGKQKTNNSTVGKGGTAISGDLRVNEAGIVVGHNSPVSVSLTVNKDTENDDRYERRYAIFQAVGKALNEALCDKMISDETFRAFSEAVTESRFLLGDEGLVAYLNEVRKRAAQFQANTISLEALPVGDERGRASAAAGEHRIWLINQIDGLSRKFEPVLSGLIKGSPYAKSTPPAPIPDMPIHDLFFHIRPDLLENAPEKRWEGVARDVMDKFSTAQLDVWGREIDPKLNISGALVQIPPTYWRNRTFIFHFLSEDKGVGKLVGKEMAHTYSWQDADGLQYTDLQLNRAQVFWIWP